MKIPRTGRITVRATADGEKLPGDSADMCKGSWRKTNVKKHLESQEPEQLGIFIQTLALGALCPSLAALESLSWEHPPPVQGDQASGRSSRKDSRGGPGKFFFYSKA